MIYLASPYSHESKAVMEVRYELALAATARLYQKGLVVYSPIVHNHNIAVNFELPRTWDFWSRIDLRILRHASDVYVLTLSDWDKSVGIAVELAVAQSLFIPITYLSPEGWELPSDPRR